MTAEQVGMAYVSALSPATRARHGRYYTPGVLADRLWQSAREALGWPRAPKALPGLVRDPAVGGGALLLPPLREHIAALGDLDPQLVINSVASVIEGIDTDPAAVWVANVVLASEMLPLLARVPNHRRKPLPALVRTGDGLSTDLAPAAVILMNPPYGRVRLSEGDRKRFGDVVYGHANLYSMFMASALDKLDDKGVLGAIVPTSFMSGRYFQPLRRILTAHVALACATFVEDRSGVFTNVLQETCVVAFTRRKVRKTKISSLGSTNTYIATVGTPATSNPWILPRRSDLAVAAAVAARLPQTLKGAGWRVRTGPLVWNRHKGDLYARPATGRYRVLWAADIKTGSIRHDTTRNDKRYVALPEASALIQRERCILVQRTSAPEQESRIVAAPLTDEYLGAGAVVIENHVNVLVPEGESAVSDRVVLALLRSRAVDKVARCISGSVALSAYELESLPLPTSETLEEWASLEDDALDIAIGETYAKIES
jgi:adenine-specific DNA-methyltransferase